MEHNNLLNTTKSNFMTYNGNMLFHFTKFESAIKIIMSNHLILSSSKCLNDISESKRESDDNIEEEINKYKSVSFTIDNKNKRAFEIDSLWGYYADKGNGVCLVFDKKLLVSAFSQLPGFCRKGKVRYIKGFSNSIFADDTVSSVESLVERKYKDIFYTKSLDWKIEREYRLLNKPIVNKIVTLNYAESLVAVILCNPLISNIKESVEFKIINNLTSIPILRYTTSLGNKELREVSTNRLLWPIIGVDFYIDL